jgi:alanine racemase
MSFLLWLRKAQKRLSKHEPLISVYISRERLLHNLKTFQKACPDQRIAPVLKSNAYGHGLIEVAQLLDYENIAFFALDSLHEAVSLRHAGVRSPILIIGYTPISNMVQVRVRNVAFTVTSLSQLKELTTSHGTFRIHLKLDTGMHRQGLVESEWEEAQSILSTNTHITLEGICSHLADADNRDNTFTNNQRTVWEKVVIHWRSYDPRIQYFHIAATAGSRFARHTTGNVVRLGLGLYGIDPAPDTRQLRPVLSIETILSGVKTVKAGDAVGYNATFHAQEPMTIATIPMGYFEGIDRRLSNKGMVFVNDIPCPIIGRVSMNITTVDVSKVRNVARGDRVVVISRNGEDPNSVENIATTTETIPWEILVHIPQHLRRTVVD